MYPYGSRLPGFWALDIRLQHCSSCALVHGLPQSHCGDNREGTLFLMIAYILRLSCFCEI